MSQYVLQNKVALHVMPNGRTGGKGTGLSPLSIDRHGFTGKSDDTVPARAQVFGLDPWGRFRLKLSYDETPGGLLSGTIEYEKQSSIDFLEKRRRDQQEFSVWEMFIPCGRRDNPQGWLNNGRLDFHGSMRVTGFNEGDAPVREAAGEPVVNSVPVEWEYDITFLPLTLSSITPTSDNATNLNAIAMLKDVNPGNCLAGYAGPDEHIYLVADADTNATAKVLASSNGGSDFAATSADPFAADEHISDVDLLITTGTQFRLVVSRGTGDAANAAEIAYADVTFGAETTTSWTTVDVGTTNNDLITVLEWIFYDRMYAAVGASGSEGEVWVSTDQGETWTQIHDDTTAIAAIEKGYGQDCKDVYFVGASNMIKVERDNSGTVETLVGPTGGGDMTAIAVSHDGLIFVGNGTSLYVNDNDAATTGGWTEVKDFAAGDIVKIVLPEGDGHNIYVVVDNASDALLYHSNDAGATWNNVTALTNSGYNDAEYSEEDPNIFFIVGDVQGSNGAVHKASPSTGSC